MTGRELYERDRAEHPSMPPWEDVPFVHDRYDGYASPDSEVDDELRVLRRLEAMLRREPHLSVRYRTILHELRIIRG